VRIMLSDKPQNFREISYHFNAQLRWRSGHDMRGIFNL
jgi:hypothetical protein